MRESEEKLGKLIIMKNGTGVGEVPLGARKISIGRDSVSDIRLNDLSVSRYHARLTRVYDEYFVEDLKSTNGTLLNHRQVSKHMLKHGDTLRIGGFTLQLAKQAEPGQARDVKQDLDRTMVLQAGSARKGAGPRQRPVAPESALLRFTGGPKKGQIARLGRSLFTIGKPGGELAAITRRPQGYFLLHIGGNRYPQVNDREINTTKGVRLNEGDVLVVGAIRAEISFRV